MTTVSEVKQTEVTMWLAKQVERTKLSDVQPEVVNLAKSALLDLIGHTLAGNKTLPGKAVVSYVKEMEAKPECTVIGAKFGTVAPYAAYANSVLAHCLELEDVGKQGSLDATAMLCVALALGEKLKLGGKEVLESYIVGHEIQGRTARACIAASSKRLASYKYGFLGCASTAAKMMKMDADGIAIAISLAASQAGGIGPTSGTMAHYLDFRTAARSGIEAAILAQKGITARKDILEGANCFLEEHVGPGDFDLKAMTAEWGKTWEASRVQLKKYACCFLSHRALDITLDLMKEHNLSYNDIQGVDLEVGLLPLSWLRFDEPTNEDESHFSFRHVLGTAILTGKAWVESFNDAAVNDPKYKAARQKVKIIPRPEWPKDRATGIKSIVHLELKDGTKLTREAVGDVIQPTEEEVINVFKDISRPFLSTAQQDRVVELILGFEKVKDISELMSIVRT